MGINDLFFTSTPNQFITCSSDRTAKVWTLNLEEKKLEEVRVLNLSEADTSQIKDNVEKQQLGILMREDSIYTVGCNSDIN